MPTRKRIEEEKKNGLLKASKSCFKVIELFKRQTETAIKVASMPVKDLAVLTTPITNLSSKNNKENNEDDNDNNNNYNENNEYIDVNDITNIFIPTESTELKSAFN
jgi:hypothetical protein